MSFIEILDKCLQQYLNSNEFSWNVAESIDKDSLIPFYEINEYANEIKMSYCYISLAESQRDTFNFEQYEKWVNDCFDNQKPETDLKQLVFFKSLSISVESEEYITKKIEQFIQKVNSKQVFYELVSSLNKKFETVFPNLIKPITIADLRKYKNEARHISDFHPAFMLLGKFIFNSYEGMLIDILKLFHPVLLVYFTVHPYSICRLFQYDSESLMKYIQEDKENIVYITFLLLNTPDHFLTKIPNQLIKDLMGKYWTEFGTSIFRKVYGNVRRYSNDFNYGVFETELDAILMSISENLHNDKIKFSWPEDWQAYSGYLLKKEMSRNESLNLDLILLQSLSRMLYFDWIKIEIEASFFVQQKTILDLYEIMHPKNQLAITLAIKSILNSEEDFWVKWHRWFKDTLLNLKPYFYSDGLSYKMQRIGTELLIFLTSIINEDDCKELEGVRLTDLLNCFQDTILYSYLSLIEMEEDVWNSKKLFAYPNYFNTDIYILNENLKKISEQKNIFLMKSFSGFLKKWKLLARAKWDWVYSAEDSNSEFSRTS